MSAARWRRNIATAPDGGHAISGWIGAAIAMGRDDPMVGALGVLVTNVVTIVVAGALTLMLERRRRRRAAPMLAARSGDGRG